MLHYIARTIRVFWLQTRDRPHIQIPMTILNFPFAKAEPIIVFDAMCVLCSANAQFILAQDKSGKFRLASMQGDVGAALLAKFGIDPNDPDTIIVVDDDKVWRNSDAVLAIYTGLGWPWRIAGVFKLVPRWFRDPVYRLVATNRYGIFGKRETCWLPTSEQAKRVL